MKTKQAQVKRWIKEYGFFGGTEEGGRKWLTGQIEGFSKLRNTANLTPAQWVSFKLGNIPLKEAQAMIDWAEVTKA